uniref:Uncharacterized protein n=1 Tax=Glossina austeni TaxID=7395 RepID=A0A1A9VT11_GLOAU
MTVKLKTAPSCCFDPRFPNQNQTRYCYQSNYNVYWILNPTAGFCGSYLNSYIKKPHGKDFINRYGIRLRKTLQFGGKPKNVLLNQERSGSECNWFHSTTRKATVTATFTAISIQSCKTT